MPAQETLILAVTRMHGGICIAGMTTEPDPVTGLCWVRPIRECGHILLGDITTASGDILRTFDVARFHFLHPHCRPPHAEDWLTDFVRQRPFIVRRLEGHRRAEFLRTYLDQAPHQVLRNQQRSLCLVKPDWLKGMFRLDSYTGKLDARLAFGLDGRRYAGSPAKGGLSVTDLKWRALGRACLPPGGGWTEFEAGDLEARFGIEEVYLAVGLSRSYRGDFWIIVVGVHTLPDYEATIDYDNL